MEKIRINNLNVAYRVERRNIKHPRIELKTGGLVLIMPHRKMDEKGIIYKHREWIHRKLGEIKIIKHNAAARRPVIRSVAEFRRLVFLYTKKNEKRLGVKAKVVRFKTMTSKWGSCSSKGSININNTMSKLPARLIDYIVCHELNHFNHRRHDREFFGDIKKYFKDYENLEKQLAEYWFAINN